MKKSKLGLSELSRSLLKKAKRPDKRKFPKIKESPTVQSYIKAYYRENGLCFLAENEETHDFYFAQGKFAHQNDRLIA